MKELLKKVVVIMMAVIIVASSINSPAKVNAAGTYTITLDANGGYFSKKSSTIFKITMPSQVGLKVDSYYSPDARANYSFLGWGTSKTATTASYPVDSVLPKKDATYYAIWRSLATTGVKIDQSNVTVKLGLTYKLTATVLPSYAANKSVKWSSSDTNIFKISNDGMITPVRSGTATATVTTVSGGYQAKETVTVVQGVKVNTSVSEKCDTKQTITYSVQSTGTTESDKIVGYTFDGEYQAITPTHATVIKKEVSTATIHFFAAVAANGATNYTSAWPFTNVTFNSNDEKDNTKEFLFGYGAKPSIADTKNLFTRDGYCLVGWSTDPNANEPDDITVMGATTYYAVWYKVNISDDPNVLSKDVINVRYSYDPTPIYITVTAPDGSIVEYDASWRTLKDIGNLSSYELKNGNLLYVTDYSGGTLTITSSDKLLTGKVKVNLFRNINVTIDYFVNDDGACTVIYYVKFIESSLKYYILDGVQYSVSDVAAFDESTNTYRIEQKVTSNGSKSICIVGNDNSFYSGHPYINVIEEKYGITREDTRTDKNGEFAATVTLKCGRVEEEAKGYYFGTSENFNENDFYDLTTDSDDNEIETSGDYYVIKHYIREAGKFYFTPIDAAGNSKTTYEVEVCEVSLDLNGGNMMDNNKLYVFKGRSLGHNELPVPTNQKQNMIFRGWYSETEFHKSIKVASNVTLTAKWRTNPFKDEKGNDTGYKFSFSQFKFGFTNFGCTKSPNGHCKAISALACRLVTSENDFDVSDFSKVEENGTLTKIKSISDFEGILGKETDTKYINNKTGITLNDYLCAYQHGLPGISTPEHTDCNGAKEVLEAVKNIKNTGVPIQVSLNGVISTAEGAVEMGHALVAYDFKKEKSTSDYAEYNLSIYDCNDNSGERILTIWCKGNEESADAEWGWEYVWSSTSILGSEYNSSLGASIYDCNN